MTFPFYSECPLRAIHIASVPCVPITASGVDIASVRYIGAVAAVFEAWDNFRFVKLADVRDSKEVVLYPL
jgi:hypothetical protein